LDAPLPHSIDESPPGAKITILKTIFSRSENQHPSAVAANRPGLTSGYATAPVAGFEATKRQQKAWKCASAGRLRRGPEPGAAPGAPRRAADADPRSRD